jgi:hypothetical protein
MSLTNAEVTKILNRKPRRTVYQMNYARLLKLGVITKDTPQTAKFTTSSNSFMDLTVERVEMLYTPKYMLNESCYAISIAHYCKQSGELLTDPEWCYLLTRKMNALKH